MADLPPGQDKYEKDILNWVNAAVAEGDRVQVRLPGRASPGDLLRKWLA